MQRAAALSRALTIALTIAITLAVTSAAALAHDTWLLPSSLRVPVGQMVTLTLTSGEAFPVDDFTIDPARVARAVVRMRGSVTTLSGATPTGRALQYKWKPTVSGVAAIGVELAPKMLTLAPEKVEEYFADINANKALRNQWAAIPSPKQWRESYSKHAKSYVRVGEMKVDRSSDTTWHVGLGFALELLPLRDPTAIHAGGTLRMRAIAKGVALAGLEVGLQGPGLKSARFQTTDANGEVTITFPREGVWLLNATSLRRSSRAGLEWESDFATMTLAVGK